MSGFVDAPVEPLLFQPNSSEVELLASFRNIPRYLFRLYGPTTAGTTSEVEVTSPAWTRRQLPDQRGKQDLFQRDPQDAGRRLHDHLRWDPAHEENCNLMSWTSSLLFAIQYGLYRNNQRNGYPRCHLRDLHILVIDTRAFPAGTFIRDMELINAFAPAHPPLSGIQEWRTRPVQRLYFGEYLSQGSLNVQGHCIQASLQCLTDCGLFSIAPTLGEQEHWHRWAKRVVELREHFENSNSRSVTVKSEMRRALFCGRKVLRKTLDIANGVDAAVIETPSAE